MEGYLNGTLDDATMHQVEKLMLESDFEEEAMEGLAMLDSEERTSDIEQLRSRLQERTSQQRVFPWWRAAAAAALLLAAGYFIVDPFGSADPDPFVAEDKTILPGSEAATSDTSDLIALNKTEKAETYKEPISAAPVEPQRKKEQVQEGRSEADARTLALEMDNETLSPDDEAMTLREAPPETAVPATAEALAYSSDTMNRPDNVAIRKPETNNSLVGRIKGEEIPIDNMDGRTVRGRIIMQDGTPIPGVNVVINGTDRGTISDIDGYYQIDAPDDASIVFSMLGMEVQEYALPAAGELNVTMEQSDATLSEVVVTGRANPQLESSRGAEPSVGKDAFLDYISRALRYPEEGNKEGHVILRLTIGTDGTIRDIKVTRSLGSPYDQEAIRLINEGPSWNPAYRDGRALEDHVRVKIEFRKKD